MISEPKENKAEVGDYIWQERGLLRPTFTRQSLYELVSKGINHTPVSRSDSWAVSPLFLEDFCKGKLAKLISSRYCPAPSHPSWGWGLKVGAGERGRALKRGVREDLRGCPLGVRWKIAHNFVVQTLCLCCTLWLLGIRTEKRPTGKIKVWWGTFWQGTLSFQRCHYVQPRTYELLTCGWAGAAGQDRGLGAQA